MHNIRSRTAILHISRRGLTPIRSACPSPLAANTPISRHFRCSAHTQAQGARCSQLEPPPAAPKRLAAVREEPPQRRPSVLHLFVNAFRSFWPRLKCPQAATRLGHPQFSPRRPHHLAAARSRAVFCTSSCASTRDDLGEPLLSRRTLKQPEAGALA